MSIPTNTHTKVRSGPSRKVLWHYGIHAAPVTMLGGSHMITCPRSQIATYCLVYDSLRMRTGFAGVFKSAIGTKCCRLSPLRALVVWTDLRELVRVRLKVSGVPFQRVAWVGIPLTAYIFSLSLIGFLHVMRFLTNAARFHIWECKSEIKLQSAMVNTARRPRYWLLSTAHAVPSRRYNANMAGSNGNWYVSCNWFSYTVEYILYAQAK